MLISPRANAADIPDQTGRTVLITGANSGLGRQTATVLARHGARVLMACRDPHRGRAAVDQVRSATGGADATLVRLDLAWPRLRICVEYDGWEAHAGREAEDAARTAELRRHGWIVIRVAVGDQRSIGELLSALRAAFGKRGYVW